MDAESGRSVIWLDVFFRNRNRISIAKCSEMRRANLDPLFIKPVLNVSMQIRIYVQHFTRGICERVKLIGHVEVVEGSLQHKWRRLLQYVLGRERSIDQ